MRGGYTESLITHGRLNVRYSLIPCILATIAGCLTLAAAAARADAPGDLMRAALATYKQPSYHVTMVSPTQGTVESDFVNPGRIHMFMKNAEMIWIDRTLYIKQNGSWRKLNVGSLPDPVKAFATSKGKFAVVDLGPSVKDGLALHEYRATNLRTQKVDLVFVDGRDRIVRVEDGPVVMRMSKFGEAVTISAPI